MRDAREDDVRDARVDELELREVADRRGLEGVVPGVVPLEVGAEREVPERGLVLVEDGADFAHVGEPVVVLCAQDEFAETAEGGLQKASVSARATPAICKLSIRTTPTASKCHPMSPRVCR